MSRIVKKGLLVLALGVVLVFIGCAEVPERAEAPRFAFEGKAPISLDVAVIETENAYQPPRTDPNIEHLLPIPPAEAALSWAKTRLLAGGVTRRLRYIVREAPIIETALEKEDGISSLVTVEQSERYAAKLVIELAIIGDDGRVEGSANLSAERSLTVPEDATLNEREAAWFKLVEEMMQDVDQRLESTIKEVFVKYLQLS